MKNSLPELLSEPKMYLRHLEEDQVCGLELVSVAGENTCGHGALLLEELPSEM